MDFCLLILIVFILFPSIFLTHSPDFEINLTDFTWSMELLTSDILYFLFLIDIHRPIHINNDE